MAGELVRYEVADRVATLTLDQPEQRNPLNDPMIQAVLGTLEIFKADDTAHVMIVTGEGKAFCAGGDLKMMQGWLDDIDAGKTKFDPIVQREWYRQGIQRIPLAFRRMDKPIIAAINGAAIGAGNDLALMCDIRIASDRARFAESFCRVGLAPGDGGAWLLTRAVGIEKACELIFTGDIIDAAEALRIGLVGRVVPHEELMSSARELAGRIARMPLQAHRMAKQAIWRAADQTIEESLEFMALMQAMLHGTADHREGVRAFMEKREPKFEGR